MAQAQRAPESPAHGVLPQLRELYAFMTEHNLDTVEVSEPELRLRLVRRAALAPAAVPVPVHIGAAAAAAPSGPSRGGGPLPAEGDGPLPQGAAAVKSGMMGIFYRAPSPSAPPFVKEGDRVKPGQVLCIIEAMKVFNELKAEFAGVVLKVLADNGKPVKAGQDIFWIERA